VVAALVGKSTLFQKRQPEPKPAKDGWVTKVKNKVKQSIGWLSYEFGRDIPAIFHAEENLVHKKNELRI